MIEQEKQKQIYPTQRNKDSVSRLHTTQSQFWFMYLEYDVLMIVKSSFCFGGLFSAMPTDLIYC